MTRSAIEPLDPRLLQTSLLPSSLHAALASGVRKLVTWPAAPARARSAAAAAVATRAASTIRGTRRMQRFKRRGGQNGSVKVSAKADYAVRAAVELASAGEGPVKAERIAQAQEIPLKFLENIMSDLRNAGLVRSQRGVEGGYWLARPADEISVAQVIRAVDGPLAAVRGRRPEDVEYDGSAGRLREVWVAVRASLRNVLETVSVADLARGDLPPAVEELAADPDAWAPH